MRFVTEHKGATGAKRIALFTTMLGCGGAEKVMLYLAEGFLARGYTVDIVLVRPGGEFFERIPAGATVIVLNSRKPLDALIPLTKYLHKVRPDILISVLSHVNWVACLAARLARSGTRCLITEANTPSVELHESNKMNRILLPLMLKVMAKSATVVAMSKGAAVDLAQTVGWPLDKVYAIYNPVINPEEWVQLCEEPAPHPWFSPKDQRVVISVGRLHRQKGFDILLQAFSQLLEKLDARLLILGEGSDRYSIEALRNELKLTGVVDLPGYVPNPAAYIARSDLFVLSSRWEGLGNVLIEAMACGVPLVATDCPNGPREILDGGRFGELVPPDDPEALAFAMEEALSNPQPANPPQEWIQQFTAEYAVDRYLEVMGLPQWS